MKFKTLLITTALIGSLFLAPHANAQDTTELFEDNLERIMKEFEAYKAGNDSLFREFKKDQDQKKSKGVAEWDVVEADVDGTVLASTFFKKLGNAGLPTLEQDFQDQTIFEFFSTMDEKTTQSVLFDVNIAVLTDKASESHVPLYLFVKVDDARPQLSRLALSAIQAIGSSEAKFVPAEDEAEIVFYWELRHPWIPVEAEWSGPPPRYDSNDTIR